MSESDRWMVIIGITIYVVGLSMLARRVALDMDGKGWPGWIFGTLVLVVPPIGALLWLAFRQAEHPARKANVR